jgi:hypothetical protein
LQIADKAIVFNYVEGALLVFSRSGIPMKQIKDGDKRTSRGKTRQRAAKKVPPPTVERIRDALDYAAQKARFEELGATLNVAIATHDKSAKEFARAPGAFVTRIAEENGFSIAEVANLKRQLDSYDIGLHVGTLRGLGSATAQELLHAVLRQFAWSEVNARAVVADPIDELRKQARQFNSTDAELEKAQRALEAALGILHMPPVTAITESFNANFTVSANRVLPPGLNLVIGSRK